MGSADPSWEARLGGQFAVYKNGMPLAAAPTRSTAVLLVGLLARAEDWSSRSELARELYPEQSETTAQVAFRQTLRRLRTWLGDDALEAEQGRVRLRPHHWITNLKLHSGEPAVSLQIAPGLDHPWLDDVRRMWSHPRVDRADDWGQSFVEAVRRVASVDSDTGRSLLVGGRTLAWTLPTADLNELLGLTRPRDRRDPWTIEYVELQASLLYRLAQFRESAVTFQRAYRLATHAKDGAAISRCLAWEMFGMLECGEMGAAETLLARLMSEERTLGTRLLRSNAMAAFHWNNFELQRALEVMRAAEPQIEAADRANRLHYWTNRSVLAAEAGLTEESCSCEEEARLYYVEALDVWPSQVFEFGEAIRLLGGSQPDAAISCLETMKGLAEQFEWRANLVYAEEALASALAVLGRMSEARRAAKRAEVIRLQGGGKFSPRVLALRKRIRSLLR